LTRIVLASGSPRRRELLTQLGVSFEWVAPDIDETPHDGEEPRAYVRRLAAAKAAALDAGDALVIAADTTVDLDGEILGKPADAVDAARMLRALSGRTHRVHTGVAVRRAARSAIEVATTFVTMIPIGDTQLRWYVGTGEPLDTAGAYAVQGAGGVLVQRIRGSVSNVVGLPLHLVARLAADLGVPLT